ncbi:hypothetical protein GWI33_006145 [Rhynchophorus ferrugineus]|uniref:Uncharacterized protein n=1 Tax=Rhynchophorus ferrugineus TaxID=354439 RepID=A0A834IM21_RHYFE|nr:hypothetical protein GWI33_006145 [Rhynchophorus ferrugineus]
MPRHDLPSTLPFKVLITFTDDWFGGVPTPRHDGERRLNANEINGNPEAGAGARENDDGARMKREHKVQRK